MADGHIAEFNVLQCADGTWEARFTTAGDDESPDATADSWEELSRQCVALRIVRTWKLATS